MQSPGAPCSEAPILKFLPFVSEVQWDDGVGSGEGPPWPPHLPGADPQSSNLLSSPIPGGNLGGWGPGPNVCTPCSKLWGQAPSKCQHSPHKYFHTKRVQHCRSAQSLSRVRLFVTSWTAARQASLSIANSQSLLKLMSIVLVMPSNRLILCRPLLLPPSTFPSIRVFSNKSVLPIRWPKHWSFSFSISPSNEYSVLISFRMDWLDLLAVQVTLKSLLQHHSL